MRIHEKVTIPFVLLVFAGIGATALLSVHLVSEALEQRFERQLMGASEMISRENLARNRSVLERIKAIIDADILTIEDGKAVASTLNTPSEQEWVKLIQMNSGIGLGTELKEPTLGHIQFSDRPYTFACRTLFDESNTVLVLLKENSDIAQAKRAVTMPVVVIGAIMAVLISLLSHLLARTITLPLQKLTRASKKLSEGDWDAMMELETDTEAGELASVLNEMARKLRSSEEMLLRSEKLSVAGYLAARVAHDIRNPLFSMKMRTQMICDRQSVGSDVRASLEPILKDIEHVEWVVQGLLDLASPVKLQLVEVNLNTLVKDVLTSIEDQLDHAWIRVEWNPASDLPLIQIDPGRLKQVLLNLMLNAAEAMPEGGILGARTALVDDSEAVGIEIWDIGQGIDPQDIEKLFDPFFTTKREGIGLGLVNARDLVESHGGTLELFPRDRRGTRAVIHLPIQSHIKSPNGEKD